MATLFRHGILLDPGQGIAGSGEIWVEEGRITAITVSEEQSNLAETGNRKLLNPIAI